MPDSIDLEKPALDKAFELALAFSDHCAEHNLPETLVINGVAFDAEALLKADRENIGWLITRFFPFGKDTKEVVLGALTDDHTLLEGDEAVPLFIIKDE